jgi:hypothetical protein
MAPPRRGAPKITEHFKPAAAKEVIELSDEESDEEFGPSLAEVSHRPCPAYHTHPSSL